MAEQEWDDLGGYWEPSLSAIENSLQGKEITERMYALELAWKEYKHETEMWEFHIPMLRGHVDFLIQSFAHYQESECENCAEELDEFLEWVIGGFARVLLGEHYEEEDTEDSDEDE